MLCPLAGGGWCAACFGPFGFGGVRVRVCSACSTRRIASKVTGAAIRRSTGLPKQGQQRHGEQS